MSKLVELKNQDGNLVMTLFYINTEDKSTKIFSRKVGKVAVEKKKEKN